jgi:hypothetical protein
MASPNVPDAETSISVSAELLCLLRSINEKLDSGGREAVESGKASSQPQQTSELFRWYESTLPGIDFVSKSDTIDQCALTCRKRWRLTFSVIERNINMFSEFEPNTPFKYNFTPTVQTISKLRDQRKYLSAIFSIRL